MDKEEIIEATKAVFAHAIEDVRAAEGDEKAEFVIAMNSLRDAGLVWGPAERAVLMDAILMGVEMAKVILEHKLNHM